MDLLAAIKREERKLEKELGQLQHKLKGVRAAAKAPGDVYLAMGIQHGYKNLEYPSRCAFMNS